MHLTARLAWHDNGWNGTICERPECNTYCVGSQSFPGDVIARLDLPRSGGQLMAFAYVLLGKSR